MSSEVFIFVKNCDIFDAYVAQNKTINDAMNELNPMDAIADVDSWAEQVNELFADVEDSCKNDVEATKALYEELCEARDEFKDDAVVWQYTVRYQPVALSNLEYVNDRIYQYERGAGYADMIDAIIAKYENLVALREANGEDAYRQELGIVKQELDDSFGIYEGLEVAVSEVPRVEDAYAMYADAVVVCEDRIAAYDNFDKKVSALAEDAAQERYTEIWDAYVALTDAQKDYTTKVDELTAREKYLVEGSIDSLDALTIAGGLVDAVAEAQNSVEIFDENQVKCDGEEVIAEEKIATLNDYAAVLELYADAKDINDGITADNWVDYVDAIADAETAVNDFESTNENVGNIKESAAEMLGASKAIVVTGMVKKYYNEIKNDDQVKYVVADKVVSIDLLNEEEEK